MVRPLVFIGLIVFLLLGCSSKDLSSESQENAKILVEYVPNLSLNCASQNKNECETEMGARCQFLKFNGEGIKRLKYDKDSPRHTFIAEMNGSGQCESYLVSEDCRIQSGTPCVQEEREILFGK